MWLTAMEKNHIAASLLLAPSHPRHHLSSCRSTAARAVVFTPLCSLIQVHSPEVIWNIIYPLLCITQGKTVLWWGCQIRTCIQLSYSILIQTSAVTHYSPSIRQSAIKLCFSPLFSSFLSPGKVQGIFSSAGFSAISTHYTYIRNCIVNFYFPSTSYILF